MKKIAIFLILIVFIFEACEYENKLPHIDITSVDIGHNTLIGHDWIIINNEFVEIKNTINHYDMNITVTNTGDYSAYDVEVDVYLYTSDGSEKIKTHFLGNIGPHQTRVFTQNEYLKNIIIDDYFVEAFWYD